MWDITLDRELYKLIPEDRILRDEPMYKHTTFRVGGGAARYVRVADITELTGILDIVRSSGCDYSVIGNGSNILVSDRGYDGLIIEVGDGMKLSGDEQYIVRDDRIEASAGMLLGRLSGAACENSLTGLEFAAGIPGTVGGAVVMNAGAYGGEMKDVIRSVTVYDTDAGSIVGLDADELAFSYRHSIIGERPYIVLKAVCELKRGSRSEIETRVRELNARRREKQPLEYPSAGSTFKRPGGFYAAVLIEECGLKGYSVGDAAVSDKHAGFVINRGRATATDIYRLIGEIREKVYADTGVRLKPEIVFMGEFR